MKLACIERRVCYHRPNATGKLLQTTLDRRIDVPAQIIDGEAIAAKIKARLAKEVEALKASGRAPRLVALQANDDAGSRIYIKSQFDRESR